MNLIKTLEIKLNGGRLAAILFLNFGVSAAIFLADLITVFNVAIGPLYVIPVLFALSLDKRRWPLFFAGTGTLLALAGYALSTPLNVSWPIPSNRAIGLVVVWMAALIGSELVIYRRASDTLDAQVIRLQTAIRKIRQVKSSDEWRAFPRETQRLIYEIEDAVGNAAAGAFGWQQMHAHKEEILEAERKLLEERRGKQQ